MEELWLTVPAELSPQLLQVTRRVSETSLIPPKESTLPAEYHQVTSAMPRGTAKSPSQTAKFPEPRNWEI